MKSAVPYRYCHNTHGRDMHGVPVRHSESYDHIPMLDGYRSGDKLTIAWQGEVSDLDGRGKTMPTLRLCERIFHIFNAPWERPDEYAGPSMSVGDVVTFHPGTEFEVSFAVASIGFVPADIQMSYVQKRPGEWLRDAEQLAEYRKAKADDLGAE